MICGLIVLMAFVGYVIARSGLNWYQDVLSEDIIRLKDKLYKLQTLGEKVYLVEPGTYIEHLVPELTVHMD